MNERCPVDGYRRVTELLRNIDIIDITKASGFRQLPSKLLKIALMAIPEIFTDFLNLCMTNSVFPEEWKTAIVICIPKGGNLQNPENLCPISLLPVTGKILETILNDKIVFHLEHNALFANEQMGFRRARSTAAGCLGLINEIYKANNVSHSLLAVFINL